METLRGRRWPGQLRLFTRIAPGPDDRTGKRGQSSGKPRGPERHSERFRAGRMKRARCWKCFRAVSVERATRGKPSGDSSGATVELEAPSGGSSETG